MTKTSVIALIDGEHHPDAVRAELDRLAGERELAAVVFCGGEEKLRPGALENAREHWGREVVSAAEAPAAALALLAAETGAGTVVDLADEPVLGPSARLRLAAHALHAGLDYEAPGLLLRAPHYEPIGFDGPKLAVIGTGKRTGKTAVAAHWARLLRAQRDIGPVIVSMGRGGPAQPELAHADTTLDDLLALADSGRHAASDYLEDALLAGVIAVGTRRVGGGLAGAPAWSNVAAGAALAASLDPGALIVEGSGACVPPVAVDRTLCVVGDRPGALEALGPVRLLRADLALVIDDTDTGLADEVAELCPGRVLRGELRPEPAEPIPARARVALFTTRARSCAGVEPLVGSTNLARRDALGADLERARAEACDVYLTELKAAAIDTVAHSARVDGARVVFVRNRVAGVDGDLDAALLGLYDEVADG